MEHVHKFILASAIVSALSGCGGDTDIDLPPVETNTAPTIEGIPKDSVKVSQDYSFLPVAKDSDNDDILTFTATGLPTWAKINSATGEITGQPNNDDVGVSNKIIISVSDGEASTQLSPYTITVIKNVINTIPSITGMPETTISATGHYSFTPTANDPDNDALLFSATGLPSWLSIDSDTGHIYGDAPAPSVQTETIVLSVSDGIATVSLPGFSIKFGINDNNRAPIISGQPSGRVLPGDEYVFIPGASDANGDKLSFSATGLPSWLSIDSDTGRIYGDAPAQSGQTEIIVLSVSDGIATVSLPGFSIKVGVNDNNSAPKISGKYKGLSEVVPGDEYVFIPEASDADGDKLTFSAIGLPDWASIDSVTGAVCGQPLSNELRLYGVTVSVTDGKETATLPLLIKAGLAHHVPLARNIIYNKEDLSDGRQEYADYTIHGGELASHWANYGSIFATGDWGGTRYLLNAAGTQPMRDGQCNRYAFSEWAVKSEKISEQATMVVRTWNNSRLDDALFDSSDDNFTTHIDSQTVELIVKYQHDLELSWVYAQLGDYRFEGLDDEIKSQLASNGNDYAAVDLSQVPGLHANELDWLNMTNSFFTDAEGNERTWYIVTNAFDGTLAVHETNLQHPYADWELFNVPGYTKVHIPSGFTYKTFDKTETIVDLPSISSFDEISGSFSFEPGFGSDPALPFHLFLNKSKAEEKLAELTKSIEPLTFPTIEEGLSPQWLTGKTLYGVWHDGYTPAFVEQLTFTSESTLERRQLLHDHGNYDGYYKVHDNGILQMDKELPFPVIQGYKIVCGSTEDYIKTHYFYNEVFDSAYLLFVDRQKALDHAASLTDTVSPCLD